MRTMPRSISPSTIRIQSIPRNLEVGNSRSKPWIDPSQLPPEQIFGNSRHRYQTHSIHQTLSERENNQSVAQARTWGFAGSRRAHHVRNMCTLSSVTFDLRTALINYARMGIGIVSPQVSSCPEASWERVGCFWWRASEPLAALA
jgi:hypothetical protein